MTMELIKQSGPHCLVTSAAMCLGVETDAIHEFLGHDGTDVWFPPHNMRGVHIQEIIDYAIIKGKTFFPIEREPCIAPDEETEPREIYTMPNARFSYYIGGRVCILIMEGHACAYDGENVFDPKGYIKPLDLYNPYEAWVMADLIMI